MSDLPDALSVEPVIPMVETTITEAEPPPPPPPPLPNPDQSPLDTTGEIVAQVASNLNALTVNVDEANNKENLDGPACSKPQNSPQIFETTVNDDINIFVKVATELKTGDDIYSMKSNPRGYCIIYNNVEFEPKHVKARNGSHTEADYLRHIFQQLGFIVQKYDNLTSKEMIGVTMDISTYEALDKHDAFVMIILTHGDHGLLMGSDGHHVEVEALVGMFNNSNCPQLKEKPKLFFIQACRGSNFDYGVMKTPTAADAVPKSQFVSYPSNLSLLPSWSDTLICYPTLSGYVALRHELQGSWMGNALIEVLIEHARDTELHEILMKVNEKIIARDGSDYRMKQVVELVYRGWRKRFFFNPGLCEV